MKSAGSEMLLLVSKRRCPPDLFDRSLPDCSARVVNAAKTPMQQPPIARLAYGMTTPVTFVDSDGYPWPILTSRTIRLCLRRTVPVRSVRQYAFRRWTAADDDQSHALLFRDILNINVSLEKWPIHSLDDPIGFPATAGTGPETGQH
ncbi:hypothetical protein EGT36_29530 [Agrobacterium sp. FDAARGOS_525]|uniref:DotH/IcmK family type IV secretion protein n=1 Tax=Agrobacterium sp. FDAARGOS_525 TaxID=2420311 RepID=UPI000F66C198|nr:hypothetical protein EGT36_29530 [Agrobacterium sp. FDAARGOS_525]